MFLMDRILSLRPFDYGINDVLIAIDTVHKRMTCSRCRYVDMSNDRQRGG